MKDFIEIVLAFCKIGVLTFGGGYTILPLLQKDIASKYKWVTDEEIIDFYAIAQCLPGIIAINTSMLIGYRRKGRLGMIAASIGMVLPSLIIILIIAAFIQNFIHLDAVKYAFNGIRVAVIVLITHATLNMWKNGIVDKPGILIFSVSLLVFNFINISPIIPVVIGAICGVIIEERRGMNK